MPARARRTYKLLFVIICMDIKFDNLNRLPKISETAFIAKSAEVIGDVKIGALSSVWFNVVIRGDRSSIKIGNKTNIQDNVVVHSDPNDKVEIGDNVTVGHSAVLHGCKINDNVIIGMNATVLDGAEIGKNSIVGAGALIPPGKKFPENSIIIGVPGTIKKQTSEEDTNKIRDASEIYVKLAKEYKERK